MNPQMVRIDPCRLRPPEFALRRTSAVLFGLLIAGLGAFVVHTVLGPFGGNPVNVRAAGEGDSSANDGANPFPAQKDADTPPAKRPWIGMTPRSQTSAKSDSHAAAKKSEPAMVVERKVRLSFFNADWETILKK